MYDDNSDTSDVNSDDIDKILENMDDLDDALLRGTLKPQGSRKEPKTVSEPKKKVAFRDLDEDDPLADLLSEDDTSNDHAKPVTVSQNKKIADLFGIKSEGSPEPVKKLNSIPLNVEETKSNNYPVGSKLANTSSLPEKITSKKAQTSKSIFNDDDEIISSLIDKPKPALSGQAKKSSLMEDLFGGFPSRAPSAEANSRKSSFKIGTGLSSHTGKMEPNPTNLNSNLNTTNLNLTKSTNTNPSKNENLTQSESATRVGYSPTTVSIPRESRRGRRPSGITDPLGLLSTSQSEHVEKSEQADQDSLLLFSSNKKEEAISKTAIKDDLPEWLGGSKMSKEVKSEEISLSLINPHISKQPNESVATNIETESAERAVLHKEFGIVYPQNTSMLLGTQFDQQAALMTMQQQEHVLRTAATLSQQNDQFSSLLENQKFKLSEQENQFNMLITRQIERQALLESQLKLQQERINGYLQTLMAQPSSIPSIFSGPEKINQTSKDHVDKETESESLVQKLQLEKMYLENTIDSLKEKHEKEMKIFDESYTRQVNILEETIRRLEQKMISSLENLETDYEAKLQKLKGEMADMERSHKEEKEELKKGHVSAIHEICIRHSQNIILLQNEHTEVIQNISKAKSLEQEAVKTFTKHKENIAEMLTKTDNVIDSLQVLQKKIEERNDTFHESREIYFQTQADHLKIMREQIEKQNETSENERKELLIAAQKLETSAIKLASDTQKRNFQYDEVEERLKIKEQALTRERELFLEQTKWERNHVEAMKEVWSKEQESRLKLLAQEREVLMVERGKLEISNRLKSGTDDVAKAELEAMIKSAQDAAASAFQERRKWQERIDEVELQKSVLQEKEDQLVVKAKQLENLTQSALAKREEGLRALKEARRIEDESNERMNHLKMQLEILAQRENRIAAEKLSLARERFSLRIGQVEKPEKDINGMETHEKFVDEPTYLSDVHSSMVKTHFTDIVDPQLILLKLDIDNKLDASSQYFNYIQAAKH
ncbi:fas-binding factor 1-like [Belonocnema kinseyi]|uniref:fas-binding factor 1-like n=1 Tax=Belonocnema kinseyi TaxID=2817044 RepID=UPI00143DA486|nr:fas-binding factor 1-like [Belonocnema kinseyi]